MSNHVTHRKQHSCGLEPSRVTRCLALEKGKWIRVWVVIKVRSGHLTVRSHPRVSIVVGPAIRFLICSHGVQSILLPSNPCRPSIHECDIGITKSESFNHCTLRIYAVKRDVVIQFLRQVIGQYLGIFVYVLIVSLDLECNN